MGRVDIFNASQKTFHRGGITIRRISIRIGTASTEWYLRVLRRKIDKRILMNSSALPRRMESHSIKCDWFSDYVHVYKRHYKKTFLNDVEAPKKVQIISRWIDWLTTGVTKRYFGGYRINNLIRSREKKTYAPRLHNSSIRQNKTITILRNTVFR